MNWTVDIKLDWASGSEMRRFSILEELTGIETGWLIEDEVLREMIREGVDLEKCVDYAERRFPW